ncbi:Tex family protein [Desulfatibacillum aliphaticivorans]|uniref:Tex family protein n=1 Tax=Desulfatibacillum aliphaticivorans TaxID=218208 RepID=UPI0003F5B3D1|nr:Tex family protein [Desulfatibacillum aliphaticivorans]
MNPEHVVIVSTELSIPAKSVEATALLLAEGATVPFISRYRKEATGSLDEVQITSIRDRLAQLSAIDDRRETILRSLEKNGHLTDELQGQVMAAQSMSELEDIYLPYKPKRRTKATIAREKGLEPLAMVLLEQDESIDPLALAANHVDPEKGVENAEDAVAGARDIIAEIISEDAQVRADMRDFFFKTAMYRSTVVEGKEEEGAKFKDYFEWEEPISKAPSHRILAMRRGENEDILNLEMVVDDDQALEIIHQHYLKGDSPASQEVKLAISDGYKRLLFRAMETEVRLASKEKADEEAVKVFADNLRHLLLASPLGRKRVLAIDPGYRTGCKVVVLDRQGTLLHYTAVFPHSSDRQVLEAEETVKNLVRQHQIEAVAIGNGTAGRETEAFVRRLNLPPEVMVLSVDESGASIYSASDVARKEFPDHDVTVRGAVSIGRRLMDPLAELVKIDPKSIGVGQYQHDVDQTMLKGALDDVVISCVNNVGVDLNTASPQLLSYVSGLGARLAQRIVDFRTENGPFRSRAALKKIPRLGPKAYEQAAGFLRIPDAENPLDGSAVHPESYHVVEAMAKDAGCEIPHLMSEESLRKQIDLNKYVTDKLGLPTLTDIMAELAKPGRDPRKALEAFSFSKDVTEMKDLEPGMELPGIVTNVTNFGAFVDVGVHQDGLVHISQLSDGFVKNPADVVKVQQRVKVRVLEVDLPRKRISLSMKKKIDERDLQRGPKGGGGGGRPPKQKKEDAPFNNPFAKLGKLGK